ncbi:MAG TPA: hypothetical protein VKG24_25690 [Pseudolabrys sp.]|nr:hypothetical protein [Pseudolabrys sp.]
MAIKMALGVKHEGNCGYSSIVEAANEADTYRRQLKLARHIKIKRSVDSQSG